LVRKRLKRVMNPMVGLDLVRTSLVKEIEVSDGVVRVALDLPQDHQFASNIRHEILEKLEHRWDVEEVVIDFLGEEE
ncbi:MAG: iron-sulfur cluster assembly protein, partial [Anaerolineae bacterium]